MDCTAPNLWDRALAILRSQIEEDDFALWLNSTYQHSFDNSTLVVAVPTMMSQNWLSNHLRDQVMGVLNSLTGRPLDVAYIVKKQTPALPEIHSMPAGKEVFRTTGLNAGYTFDTFVLGESNRFAHSMALEVCKQQKGGYNLLFMHGGSGLGKTHLMHAIGNEYSRLKMGTAVYVTGEDFTNAFLRLRNQQDLYPAFRDFYRNVDLLLLDDVQFFMGKQTTQQEFFHTFDTLHAMGKKIVISSDRSPKELDIQERLRSRFEYGLLVDIQPPTLPLRIAILQAKAQACGLDLPYDQAMQIAERVKTNIRKLEGVVTLLKARSNFGQHKFTREDINRLIEPFVVQEERPRITADMICEAVCEFFSDPEENLAKDKKKAARHVALSDLTGKSKARKYSIPRYIAIYICREMTEMSLGEIGDFFGNRDHSTILYAIDKIQKKLNKNDKEMQHGVSYIRHQLDKKIGQQQP